MQQDDEYYEDGLFTRADEMMTRSGGESGGYVPIIPSEPDTIVQPELPLHFLFIMNLKMKRLFVMLILQDIQ